MFKFLYFIIDILYIFIFGYEQNKFLFTTFINSIYHNDSIVFLDCYIVSVHFVIFLVNIRQTPVTYLCRTRFILLLNFRPFTIHQLTRIPFYIN